MRIGIFFPTKEHGSLAELISQIRTTADEGFSSAWLPQSTGFDALTVLAVAGMHAPTIEFGTAVVPIFPRHPMSLAAQALTTSAATDGRFVLGIGLSHKSSIETRYGLRFENPARHMDEYLSVLLPLLREREVDFVGTTLVGRGGLDLRDIQSPPVLLAALQPRMLRLAGSVADGTITWCTGPITLEKHIVPIITLAAEEARRPPPRVVVALPIIVTDDERDGRAKAGEQLAGYGQAPVYRAVLDREGVEGPADVSIVGDERSVSAQLRRLADIGATDFVAILAGNEQDRRRTRTHLASLESSQPAAPQRSAASTPKAPADLHAGDA